MTRVVHIFTAFLGVVTLAAGSQEFRGSASTRVAHEAADDLFGEARTFSLASEQTVAYPRVLFDQEEWMNRVVSLAEDIFTPHTFSYNFVLRTWGYMNNTKLFPLREEMTDADIDAMVESNAGAVYTGENEAQAFFVQAQRAFVFRESAASENFPGCTHSSDIRFRRCVADEAAAEEFMNGTKRLIVNWARFVKRNREQYGGLTGWSIYNAFKIGSGGYILALDVMMNELSGSEQELCLSVMSDAVKDVTDNALTGVWGWQSPISRIWSNWAAYNSQVYLLNCLLEGTEGYSEELNTEYIHILQGFMENSIYESGFSFEDGYTASTALREGSATMVALARREHNFLDTDKFRRFISYTAHSYEPWRCSRFIGHGSGSGNGKPYHSFIGLFRYAYPNGALSNMVWRSNVDDLLSCYYKGQSTMDTALFGDDSPQGAAEDPSSVVGSNGATMPLSIYGQERGLLIARSSLAETALYVHVNARPDAMFPGHDNADRGSFTLTSHRHSWSPSLPWRKNYEAKKHNMVFIDGVAQHDLKAPPASMVHDPIDDLSHVISTVNLTYATTYKWNAAWSTATMDYSQREPNEGWEREMTDPRDLGFPREYADEINLPSSMWGHADWGFMGLYQWRALYNPVRYNIRSTVLTRDHSGEAYFVVGDAVEKYDSGLHMYTWEMTLDSTTSSEFETLSDSAIVLSTTESGKDDAKLGVYVATNCEDPVSFEVVPIMESTKTIAQRLIVRQGDFRSGAVRFTVVLHPFSAGLSPEFSVYGDSDGDVLVTVAGSEKTYSMENSGGARMAVDAKQIELPPPTVWRAMSTDVGSRPPPPPTMRIILPDGIARSSIWAVLMSDTSKNVFDPEAAASHPFGYEHLLLFPTYSPGKYLFTSCQDGDDHADLAFYRWTIELTGPKGAYYAYLERRMEKLYGFSTPTCAVEIELDGPGIFLVQAVSNSESLSLAMSVV